MSSLWEIKWHICHLLKSTQLILMNFLARIIRTTSVRIYFPLWFYCCLSKILTFYLLLIFFNLIEHLKRGPCILDDAMVYDAFHLLFYYWFIVCYWILRFHSITYFWICICWIWHFKGLRLCAFSWISSMLLGTHSTSHFVYFPYLTHLTPKRSSNWTEYVRQQSFTKCSVLSVPAQKLRTGALLYWLP